jgi:hypothetical protein
MSTSSEYASGSAGQVQPVVVAAPPSGYFPGGANRPSDRWPWVAVAVIAAIAAIAVAYLVTVGKEQRSVPITTVAQAAAHHSSTPRVITRTVHGPTKTIIRREPVYTSAPSEPISVAGSCGGGINVNAQTSCAFAQNVVEQYTQQAEQAGGPGSFDVYAYSPVTGLSYTDLCTYTPPAAVVSCSHGSDLIQFAYVNVVEPVSTPASAAPISAGGTCGSGISVNAQTSCPFAENVVGQYTRQAQQAGASRSFDVSAYSPVTGKNYTDSCGYSLSTGIVSCSHGSDLIQFAYGSH